MTPADVGLLDGYNRTLDALKWRYGDALPEASAEQLEKLQPKHVIMQSLQVLPGDRTEGHSNDIHANHRRQEY
ncbi:hypothetical protein GCM10009582_08470 [Arthrobacter flavus]